MLASLQNSLKTLAGLGKTETDQVWGHCLTEKSESMKALPLLGEADFENKCQHVNPPLHIIVLFKMCQMKLFCCIEIAVSLCWMQVFFISFVLPKSVYLFIVCCPCWFHLSIILIWLHFCRCRLWSEDGSSGPLFCCHSCHAFPIHWIQVTQIPLADKGQRLWFDV